MTDSIDLVCKRFCPVIRLHPDERFPPCSVPDLMRRSKFEFTSNIITTAPPIIAKADAMDAEAAVDDVFFDTTPPPSVAAVGGPTLDSLQSATTEQLSMLLAPYTSKRGSTKAYKFDIIEKSIPNSVEIQAVFSDPFRYMNKTYFTLTYILFFAYNGTLEPHVFDQEYATFIFTCDSYAFANDTMELTGVKPARVYLSSHGKGKWYEWSELKMSNSRPVVYCALEGHALYPEPVVIRRFFGFGNDETADGGVEYDPIDNVVVLAHPSSTLISPYYEKNKLYYFNGLYNDQPSALFRSSNINFIFYDGYYKTSNTSEMWDIKPFSTFKWIFRILLIATTTFVMLAVFLKINTICDLGYELTPVIFTVVATFLFMWMHVV